MYLGRDSPVSVFMIFAVSVDGKSLVQVFAVCMWDMAGLLHSCWCMKEGIFPLFLSFSFIFTDPSAISSLALLHYSYISFPTL